MSIGTEILSNNDGWIIFRNATYINGEIKVYNLIHAGSSENFYFDNKEKYDAYRAEYLLSGGQRVKGYSTLSSGISINPRKWDMYKDKELDKKGYINDVHLMTESDNNYNGYPKNYWEIRNTGGPYFLASIGKFNKVVNKYYLYANIGGYINEQAVGNLPVRPIVELTDNVYISSGSGTKDDPYILRKEAN